MNRDKWIFPYSADKLLAAATEKFEFSTQRQKWWTDKKEEVMTKIKAEGLEIDESVALGYSNSGRGTSVNIRNDLLADLTECVNKINEHNRKIADYEAWQQVLNSQGQAQFSLNQDDWLFFFGK